jgi:hypothetical protein
MKQRAVRLRDSDALREEARQVVDVLEHVEGTDDIELRVGPCGSVVEGDASDVVDYERASRVCDRAAAKELLPGHARRTERPALVEKEPRAAANIEDPPASDQAHLVQHPREGLGL